MNHSGQVGTVYGEISELNPQEGPFQSIVDWVKFFDQWIEPTEWQDAKPQDTALDPLQ